MEASEIMKMVENEFYNRFFIIDVIFSDDHITLKDVLNHPYKGAQGQVLNSSKGNLDEEEPEPYFLVDPYDHVNVVAKHIFSIINKSRAQRCGCTKEYALRLKKDWGYTIEIIGNKN